MDLLPAYQAGEASADTRQLVEAFLASDAELAGLVSRGSADRLLKVDTPPVVETERRAAFDTTRRWMAVRTWSLGLAIFFWLLPLSMAGGTGRVTWVMWRDEPPLAILSVAVAAVITAVHIFSRRRLRVARV
jgi:anti-sigma factor RsiW